jgi:hypothetical protein
MKSKLIVLTFIFGFSICFSQEIEQKNPIINVRLSFLIFHPIAPLLTFEVRTIDTFTLQFETNFANTHGINLKYFLKEQMNKDFLFLGTAFVQSDYLRKDLKQPFCLI